jgi:hypothetical protein
VGSFVDVFFLVLGSEGRNVVVCGHAIIIIFAFCKNLSDRFVDNLQVLWAVGIQLVYLRCLRSLNMGLWFPQPDLELLRVAQMFLTMMNQNRAIMLHLAMLSV